MATSILYSGDNGTCRIDSLFSGNISKRETKRITLNKDYKTLVAITVIWNNTGGSVKVDDANFTRVNWFNNNYGDRLQWTHSLWTYGKSKKDSTVSILLDPAGSSTEWSSAILVGIY